jgi:uncharacterized membrane protein YciS (DUF1049 family)
MKKKTGFHIPEVAVICFSIAIIVLIIANIGWFIRFNMRNNKNNQKIKTAEISGN